MQRIGNFLDNHFIITSVRKLVKIFITIMFALLVLVVFMQVVARFVFNDPFRWSEELARYLQVWMIILTSSICIREGTHLAVDYATHILPFVCRKLLKLLVLLLMMSYLIVVIVYGARIVSVITRQVSPAMQIPIYIVYLAVPIGGSLMFIEALISFFKLTGAKNKEDL
ncbi:hypothetical protein ES705_25269 [subsurface metagenome]